MSCFDAHINFSLENGSRASLRGWTNTSGVVTKLPGVVHHLSIDARGGLRLIRGIRSRCARNTHVKLLRRASHCIVASGDSRNSRNSEEPQLSARAFIKQASRSLRNSALGKGSINGASMALPITAGAVLFALTVWAVKGYLFGSRSGKYEVVLEFPHASGIAVGTSVRLRGVDMGTVVRVKPSLQRIDVTVEVIDASIMIPQNSLVELNESGLLSETLIDITPRHPLPKPSTGPFDPGCSTEGLIVCDKGRIRGDQGVSLDVLIGLCNKMARRKELGVGDILNAIKSVKLAEQSNRVLLAKVETFLRDMEPTVKDMQTRRLLKSVEDFVKTSTNASHYMRNYTSSSEKSGLLLDSSATVAKTLKHLERTTEHVGRLTGDVVMQNNLKQLIELLSRLVSD